MTLPRKCPCSAVELCTTNTFGWNAAIRPSSLRSSCLPECAAPNRVRSESWPVRLAVEACPPVFEYTPVFSTITLIGVRS